MEFLSSARHVARLGRCPVKPASWAVDTCGQHKIPKVEASRYPRGNRLGGSRWPPDAGSVEPGASWCEGTHTRTAAILRPRPLLGPSPTATSGSTVMAWGLPMKQPALSTPTKTSSCQVSLGAVLRGCISVCDRKRTRSRADDATQRVERSPGVSRSPSPCLPRGTRRHRSTGATAPQPTQAARTQAPDRASEGPGSSHLLGFADLRSPDWSARRPRSCSRRPFATGCPDPIIVSTIKHQPVASSPQAGDSRAVVVLDPGAVSYDLVEAGCPIHPDVAPFESCASASAACHCNTRIGMDHSPMACPERR